MQKQAREKVRQFVQLAGHLVKRAMTELDDRRRMDKQAADMTSPLIQTMLERKLLSPGSMQKAAEKSLSTHVGSLEVVDACLEKIASLQQDLAVAKGINPGRPAEKQASAVPVMGSVDSPFCGARTPYMKPSDRVYKEAVLAGRR